MIPLGKPEPWTVDALCVQVDPDLFFPEVGEYTKAKAAKRVCTNCPVIAECLEYALRHGETFGVWGGTAAVERRRMIRERRDTARAAAA